MDEIEKKAREVLLDLQKKTHLSRDMLALYSSRILMRISLGSLNVFLPIFFYTQFNQSLEMVILIFATMYLLHMLFTPLATKLLSVWGMKVMIGLGMLFAILGVGSLYFAPMYLQLSAALFTIFSAIYRALYWIPYHVDFAHMLSRAHRGRQLAFMRNVSGALVIVAPIIGGVIITSMGFSYAFVYAAVIMLLGLLPLAYVHNTYEKFSWDYIDTFTHLFNKVNRPILLAHAANGAQGMAVLVFWPLYVFTLLDERYTAVGIITSLTLIAVLVMRYVVGKLFDTWSEKRMLLVGVLFSTTGWMLKVFVSTPLQIFAADTYHQFGRTTNTLTFDATTYEQSADAGRYIDEYTALKEMAMNVGRLIMLAAVWALAATFGIKVAFVLAAIVTLLMITLNKGAKVV